MAQQTYAQVAALALNDAERQAALTQISGQNIDGTAYSLPVTPATTIANTATLSNVASSATNVTLLAANTARLGAIFFNDSTAVLYLKFGATASTSSYTVQLATNTSYTLPAPTYTGRIDGLWASANGNLRVTEITA